MTAVAPDIDAGPETGSRLPVRRIRFDYPDDVRAVWHPGKPEFAAACNALSLGMPYGEPYVVASVRAQLGQLDDGDAELKARAQDYLDQERQHHRQHKRFNEIVTDAHPGLLRIEGWLRTTYRWLARRGSAGFNVAFAAGFETVAFASARWADKRVHSMFTGADPVPATMFLWHLAEEVEHKTVAFDVWQRTDGSRLRYAAAMTTSFVLLAWFILIGTIAQLVGTRRIFNPLSWVRLIAWAISLAFEVIPVMVLSALPGHHPRDMADPSWLTTWLSRYDPASDTMPLWNEPI